MLDNNKKYNIDPKKIILLGDSAGGNICENLCQMLAKTTYKPLYQVINEYWIESLDLVISIKWYVKTTRDWYIVTFVSISLENDPSLPKCIPPFAGNNMVEYYITSAEVYNIEGNTRV